MTETVDATFLRRCLGTLDHALAAAPGFLADARDLADRIEEPRRG